MLLNFGKTLQLYSAVCLLEPNCAPMSLVTIWFRSVGTAATKLHEVIPWEQATELYIISLNMVPDHSGDAGWS